MRPSAASTSAARARGTTTTPSASPTTMSPGLTCTPPSTTGAPTVPGPFSAGEFGTSPMANSGSPVATIPARSRASPSVTKAATPLLRIIPAARSPITAVAVKPSQASMITSPACASASAPNIAAMSAG